MVSAKRGEVSSPESDEFFHVQVHRQPLQVERIQHRDAGSRVVSQQLQIDPRSSPVRSVALVFRFLPKRGDSGGS